VTLSPDQETALAGLDDFVRDLRPRRRYKVLHGLAGTGKTHLMAILAKRYRGALLCAFTGKAASVLRARTGLDTLTVHQAIYQFRGLVDDPEDATRKQPVFSPLDHDLSERLVLLDECSTIGTVIAEELLKTGARVIACGDPGQLPPVMDRQFFTDPDLVLTQVHRQAWGSPIIRQAHQVRTTGSYEPDGPDFRVETRASEKDLAEVDIALCWRNRTRQLLNQRRREVKGLSGPLKAGEPVMCLKNRHEDRIYNGEVYTVLDVDGDVLTLLDGERRVVVKRTTVEGFDPGFNERRYLDTMTPFALAYASTVHKAQGSEQTRVMVVDENDGNDRRAWLYTALTRASGSAVVIRRNQ
jgi:exodeoxyribonuclease V